MGRTSVRAAIVAYLDGEVVPALMRVHASKPRNWAVGDFRSATEFSTAAAYVYIEHTSEQREANGKKSIHYIVSLQLVFRSRHTNPDVAMTDFDGLIENIKTRLRAKPPLGGAAGIYEAAEHLLEDDSDLTRDTALTQNTRALVRFDVSEWFNA